MKTARLNRQVAGARGIINRTTGGMPRYMQLGTLFRGHIMNGRWRAGEQIPTVDELVAEYGVAPGTVSRALGLLESDGLLRRYRAKGTFVSSSPRAQLWCEVQTELSTLLRARAGQTIELLGELPDQAPPELFHSEGTLAPAYRKLKRRHWRGGAAFCVVDLYIEESIFGRIPRADLTSKSSLGVVSSLPGLELADVRQTLIVDEADLLVAEMLDIPVNSAVAHVQRSALDQSSKVVMITNGTYRGDVVRLDFKLK